MRRWVGVFFIASLTFLLIGASLEQGGKIQIKGAVTDAAFSPDGKFLVTASSKGIDFWDISLNSQVKNIDDRTALSVAFSPKGDVFAYGTIDGKINICSVPDCAVSTEIDVGKEHIRHLAFTSDGGLIITNLLNAFDPSGKLKFQLKNESPANAIAISPDDKTLVSAHQNGHVLLWNLKRKKITAEIAAHPKDASEVAFLPALDRLLTANLDGTVKTWNLADLGQVLELNHPSEILSLAVSPQGRLLAVGTQDGKITLWDARTGDNLGSFVHWPNIAVDVLVFSPDGNTLISGSWGLVKKWIVK